MKDTPKHILIKQLEIIRSKTIAERIKMAFEMPQFVFDMAEYRIMKREPNLSKREMVAQRFKEIYAKDFEPEELERIVKHLQTVQ